MLLADRGRVAQAVGPVVVPCCLGAVAGVLAGVSAPAYWVLQALLALGGFLGGLEHRGVMSGANRGVVGGLLFGSVLLLARALSGLEDKVSLGDQPGFLPLVTAIIGAVLGGLGGGLRARLERR